MKARRRLQLEEIADNSLALVPYEPNEVDPVSFSIPKDSEQEIAPELRPEVCTEKECASGLGENKGGCNEEAAAEVDLLDLGEQYGGIDSQPKGDVNQEGWNKNEAGIYENVEHESGESNSEEDPNWVRATYEESLDIESYISFVIYSSDDEAVNEKTTFDVNEEAGLGQTLMKKAKEDL